MIFVSSLGKHTVRCVRDDLVGLYTWNLQSYLTLWLMVYLMQQNAPMDVS
jgi:hypothetical protein